MRRDHARGSEEPGHLLEEMSGGVIDAVRPAESAHRHITTPSWLRRFLEKKPPFGKELHFFAVFFFNGGYCNFKNYLKLIKIKAIISRELK